MKFLDKEQRDQIGFSYIIDKLEVITSYGVEEKKNIKPFKKEEKEKLIKELDNTEKIIESIRLNSDLYKDIGRIFCKVKDIRATIKRCESLETLDDVELYEIKYFSFLMGEFINIYNNLGLNIMGISFKPLDYIIYLLDPEDKKIPTFYIYDKYSEKLKSIRKEKRRLEEQIFLELDYDKVASIKEERLNLIIEEEEEELVIRKTLTLEISKHVKDIEENIISIGKLDFLISKGKLALEYKGIRPKISEEVIIDFEDAFNPEILQVLEEKQRTFTPLNIKIKNGTTVVTGANMGGKSVSLKTIVLNLLLGQMGFFVFAKSAEFPVLDFIYFISDDMQSISKGLSTFGAEIIKIKEVVECVKRETGFLALDEFARGTNPKEGFYLVKSLCKFLMDFQSISLISTHYDGVVEEDMVHYQVVGLKNVDFHGLKHKIDLNKKHSVEIIQENMEYRLERVSKENEVPKDALNIAVLLGLQKGIVDIAKTYYEENN